MNKEKSLKILNNCLEFIKNIIDKQDEIIKGLKEDYKVDRKMGSKLKYTKWLEIRYVELYENLHTINKHRQELLLEKHMKDSE